MQLKQEVLRFTIFLWSETHLSIYFSMYLPMYLSFFQLFYLFLGSYSNAQKKWYLQSGWLCTAMGLAGW